MDDKNGIIIVEPRGLHGAALAAMIAKLADVRLLASIDNFHAAAVAVERLQPRLVLSSFCGPNSRAIEFMHMVKRRHNDVRVLAVDFTGSNECVETCVRAGFDGFVSLYADYDAFAAAVRSAVAGRHYSNSDRTAGVFPDLGSGARRVGNPVHLTQREREVLRLVAAAASNKLIAKIFNVSLSTVEKHRASMMRKLELRTSAGVTAYAVANGWTSVDDVLSRQL
jgi:DNA-binding NarL/FixJ family response regulator